METSFSIKSHTSQPGEDTFLLCSIKEATKDRPEVHLSVSLYPMQVLDLLGEAGWVSYHCTDFTFGYVLRLLPWLGLLGGLYGVT